MTHNILDVLTYMFDFLFESAEQDSEQEIDDATLKAHLSEAGFDDRRIDKALRWLENIAALQDGRIKPFTTTHQSLRVYNKEERSKLDAKAQGFLLFMEHVGQLDANQREMVIAQIMSLEEPSLSLDDLKWVIMMVLGNNADESIPAQWLESIVFQEDNPKLQ